MAIWLCGLLSLSVACSGSGANRTPLPTGSVPAVVTATTGTTVDDRGLPFEVYRHSLRPEGGYPAALLSDATLTVEGDCLLLRAGGDAWVPLWPMEVTLAVDVSGPSASVQGRRIAGSEPAEIGGGEIALGLAEEHVGRAISDSCPAGRVWLVAEFSEP